eukprot:ctg_71.g14
MADDAVGGSSSIGATAATSTASRTFPPPAAVQTPAVPLATEAHALSFVRHTGVLQAFWRAIRLFFALIRLKRDTTLVVELEDGLPDAAPNTLWDKLALEDVCSSLRKAAHDPRIDPALPALLSAIRQTRRGFHGGGDRERVLCGAGRRRDLHAARGRAIVARLQSVGRVSARRAGQDRHRAASAAHRRVQVGGRSAGAPRHERGPDGAATAGRGGCRARRLVADGAIAHRRGAGDYGGMERAWFPGGCPVRRRGGRYAQVALRRPPFRAHRGAGSGVAAGTSAQVSGSAAAGGVRQAVSLRTGVAAGARSAYLAATAHRRDTGAGCHQHRPLTQQPAEWAQHRQRHAGGAAATGAHRSAHCRGGAAHRLAGRVGAGVGSDLARGARAGAAQAGGGQHGRCGRQRRVLHRHGVSAYCGGAAHAHRQHRRRDAETIAAAAVRAHRLPAGDAQPRSVRRAGLLSDVCAQGGREPWSRRRRVRCLRAGPGVERRASVRDRFGGCAGRHGAGVGAVSGAVAVGAGCLGAAGGDPAAVAQPAARAVAAGGLGDGRGGAVVGREGTVVAVGPGGAGTGDGCGRCAGGATAVAAAVSVGSMADIEGLIG